MPTGKADGSSDGVVWTYAEMMPSLSESMFSVTRHISSYAFDCEPNCDVSATTSWLSFDQTCVRAGPRARRGYLRVNVKSLGQFASRP